MKQSVRLLLVTTAAILMAVVAGAADIRSDSFEVTLPAGFGASARTATTTSNIETTMWLSKAPTGEAVAVSISRMPARIANATKLMDSTRDSLLKSLQGTLESEEKVAGTMPARKLVFRAGSAFLQSRLVVSGDRLYQVLYVGRSEEQRSAAGQIFDSFRIVAPAMTASATAPAPAGSH